MTVSLTVEDGSNVQGANSYISLADANTYLNNWYGVISGWGASDDTLKTNALYYAAFALDRLYGRRYLSILPPTSTQSMLWPRYTFMDNLYRLIPGNTVPQYVRDAQCELAQVFLVAGDPASLFPNESDNRLFKNIQVDAGVKVNQTYWEKPKDVERYDGFRKIELILYPILVREDNTNARWGL